MSYTTPAARIASVRLMSAYRRVAAGGFRSALPALLALLSCAVAGLAKGPETTPADLERLMRQFRPGCVTLNYYLRYDRTEEPFGRGFRCPNCGGFHDSGLSEHVTDQYPLRATGYLVGDRQVVSANLHIPSRFIARIVASFGDQETDAVLGGWAIAEDAVRLDLAQPLPGAAALVFQPDAAPVRQLAFALEDGLRQLCVEPMSEKSLWCEELGQAYRVSLPSALCLDASDRPVGLSIRPLLSVGDRLRPPAQWTWLDVAGMQATLARIESRVKEGIVPVRLNFRVERAGPQRRSRAWDSDGDEDASERHCAGLLVAPDTLAILVALDPAQTATLTGLTATTPQGAEVTGTFVGQLRDYGVVIARFPGVGGTPLVFNTDAPAQSFLRLAVGVALRPVNNRLFTSVGTSVIEGFETGPKGHLAPDFPLSLSSTPLLFDLEGRLLAVPCEITAPLSSGGETLLNGRLAASVLSAPEAHFNPASTPSPDGRPLPPPWFGAELQALTPEIAAERHMDFPNEEPCGALVSAVTPGSPAAQVGLRKDDIVLLWGLEAASQVPLEFDEDYGEDGGETFPWQELDRVPEAYFDRIPLPWPSPHNALVDHMAAIGVGGTLHLTWQRDDGILTGAMAIVQGPPTFDTAPKHRDRTLGLTLKTLTSEVRSYLKLDAEAPGLVVAVVVPGSKAAVAGIKPYELITKVNDTPATTLEAFAETVKTAPDEVRLTVSRIGKDRIVKLKKTRDGDAKPAVEPTADAMAE